MSSIGDAVRTTWAGMRIDGAAATMTDLVDEIVERGPMGENQTMAWDAAWDKLAFETNRPVDLNLAQRFDDAVETIEEFYYAVSAAGMEPADDRAPWDIRPAAERVKGEIELIRSCRPNTDLDEWTQGALDACTAALGAAVA